MSKQKAFNKVQVKLAVAPPPPKTWQTPTYQLDHYTLRRHTRVVSIQLVGVRGNEKRTESISLPLLSGITDSDYIRAAIWFSPNKWQASFRVNVSQFGGTFSQPVSEQLLYALMKVASPSSTHMQSHPQQQLHEVPTEATLSFYQQPVQPQTQHPRQFQPSIRPGQFQPLANQRLPLTSNGGRKGNGIRQWYHTRTRKVKVGLGCVTLIAVLLLLSIVSTAIGSGNPTRVPVSSPTSQAAAPTSSPTPPPVITSATQPPPTHTLPTPTATPRPRPTPTPTPPVVVVTPTPIPPTPTPCPGVNCNPYGYNFVPGNLIYYPPAGFCSYFPCISSFVEPDDPGDGYVVECSDGMYSQSGGERGACSYHGGVSRPLYSH